MDTSFIYPSFPDTDLNSNAHQFGVLQSGTPTAQMSNLIAEHLGMIRAPSRFLLDRQYTYSTQAAQPFRNEYDGAWKTAYPFEFPNKFVSDYSASAATEPTPVVNYPNVSPPFPSIGVCSSEPSEPTTYVNPYENFNAPTNMLHPDPSSFAGIRSSVSSSSAWSALKSFAGASNANGENGDYAPFLAPPSSPAQTGSKSSPPRRYSPYGSSPSPPSSTSTTSSTSSASQTGPRPRNIQATQTTQPMEEVLAAASVNFCCAVCGHEQKNKRLIDLHRHIRSHYRLAKCQKWLCGGIAVDRATAHTMMNPYCVEGQWFAGGCNASFSRSDALKRHIDNTNLKCVSILNAPYNKEAP